MAHQIGRSYSTLLMGSALDQTGQHALKANLPRNDIELSAAFAGRSGPRWRMTQYYYGATETVASTRVCPDCTSNPGGPRTEEDWVLLHYLLAVHRTLCIDSCRSRSVSHRPSAWLSPADRTGNIVTHRIAAGSRHRRRRQSTACTQPG